MKNTSYKEERADSRRTAAVLSLVRCKLSLSRSVEDLVLDYQNAKPFPHLVLDNFFPSDELNSLLDELPPASSEKWVHEQREEVIKSNLRSAVDLEERGYLFSAMLHSAAFLYLLTEITGIRALLPDPYLSGGGYHVVDEGGKFEVHADRNSDHYCGMERRLAMLIYLNKTWKPEFGGQLELWNQDATRCERVIEPVFNRTVIFEVGDRNFHAVRPVVGSQGVQRKVFAAYFHTVSRDLVIHNSIFAPLIYQERTPMMRRVARGLTPPFLWRALDKLIKLQAGKLKRVRT